MIFVSAKFFGPIKLGNRTFYLKTDSGKKRLEVDLLRIFWFNVVGAMPWCHFASRKKNVTDIVQQHWPLA